MFSWIFSPSQFSICNSLNFSNLSWVLSIKWKRNNPKRIKISKIANNYLWQSTWSSLQVSTQKKDVSTIPILPCFSKTWCPCDIDKDEFGFKWRNRTNRTQRKLNFGNKAQEVNTYMAETVRKDLPIWFNYFKHHIVLKVLHKVNHSLTKVESCWEPMETIAVEAWTTQCKYEIIHLLLKNLILQSKYRTKDVLLLQP